MGDMFGFGLDQVQKGSVIVSRGHVSILSHDLVKLIENSAADRPWRSLSLLLSVSSSFFPLVWFHVRLTCAHKRFDVRFGIMFQRFVDEYQRVPISVDPRSEPTIDNESHQLLPHPFLRSKLSVTIVLAATLETRKILIVISVSVGGFIYPFWQCTGGARQNAWFGTQEHERRTTMDVLSREKKRSFQVVERRENLNMAVMVMLIE
ncbi:hypothetical protein LXL04_017084 [Taraxacum kok-saghyz]